MSSCIKLGIPFRAKFGQCNNIIMPEWIYYSTKAYVSVKALANLFARSDS